MSVRLPCLAGLPTRALRRLPTPLGVTFVSDASVGKRNSRTTNVCSVAVVLMRVARSPAANRSQNISDKGVQAFGEAGGVFVVGLLVEEQLAEVEHLVGQVINVRVEFGGALCGVLHRCVDVHIAKRNAVLVVEVRDVGCANITHGYIRRSRLQSMRHPYCPSLRRSGIEQVQRDQRMGQMSVGESTQFFA
jgi:hypothetical protein